MKYILAISGGVDSVVLLDMWAKKHAPDELIVCHFDHGIREESAEDARFVQALADHYGLEYYTGRAALGEAASEEVARAARYDFLCTLAAKHEAVIVTAHHLDDLVESVVINLHRGTGWRGVAVMNRSGIVRPLLSTTKQQLYEYATDNRLEWVEDRTNHDRRYLRNRVRLYTHGLPRDTKTAIAQLRDEQVQISKLIEAETAAVSCLRAQSRHFYIMVDRGIAHELLRAYCKNQHIATVTTPQYDRLLHAIKTARPGSRYDLGRGNFIHFTSREFSVEVLS